MRSTRRTTAESHRDLRIIQEALSNIVKHSGATRASVSLGMDGDALRLVISDDGKGFSVAEKLADVSVKSGLGLKSLPRAVHSSVPVS